MLTIIGYGACYDAYGVLIGPIDTDTGWPDAALGAIFSGALGPIAAGALLGATGSSVPAITIISAGFAAAAGVLLLGGGLTTTELA